MGNKKLLREYLPITSTVYGVILRNLPSGKREVKYLTSVNGKIEDLTLLIARFINIRANTIKGTILTTDPGNIINTVAIKLFPELDKPFEAIKYARI